MSQFSSAEGNIGGDDCLAITDITDHPEPWVQQNGAIIEDKAILNDIQENAMEKLQLRRLYEAHVTRCRKDTRAHLQSIRSEVDSVIFEEMKRAKGREQEEDAKIDQEIDEKNQKLEEKIGTITCMIGKNSRIRKINDEIRKNSQERELRHKQNHANTEIIQEATANRQGELHADIEHIAVEIEGKIGELEKCWQDDTKTTMGTIRTLNEIPTDGENVVKDLHIGDTSVDDGVEKRLDEGGLDHITRTVSSLKFMKVAGRERCGRIDGYDGEWRLVDTINVTDQMNDPKIVGCIDESVITISTNDDVGMDAYALDMNSKHIQRVVPSDGSSWVNSCALLNDGKIVCGNYRECSTGFKGDSITGLISVYDRKWKLISNDVTIPRNGAHLFACVDIDIDHDGMIIATDVFQSTKIYVINPADGNIVRTTGITSKEIMIRGVLSSGHIIAHPWPANRKLFKIDSQGAQMEIPLLEFPQYDDIRNVCVDPVTDALYVLSSDSGYSTCMIDHVMEKGDMKMKRVASFSLANRLQMNDRKSHLAGSSVIMTSTGKIIACDGDNILVFKKLFKL